MEQTLPLATHDYSAWGMFLSADIVVKLVMMGLLLASLVSWVIFIAKLIQLNRNKKSVHHDYSSLDTCRSINDFETAFKDGDLNSVTKEMLLCVQAEIPDTKLPEAHEYSGIKERTQWGLETVITSAMQRMASKVSIITTIGAIAPFVGLFGTVWGIMNSFIGIAQANTTSLSVIAPGIAEALLATGLGLIAAIPAVIFNNILAKGARNYKISLVKMASELMRILSRSFEIQNTPPHNISSQAAE
ncbi:MAG: tonB-system energizer ExbB [Robiginitomaculum sp.]|nr:MAG: tonB-system energizer ExbB [Robiginitomaculum sp.]